MSPSNNPKSDRFLGLPGSWTFPGWPAVWRNLWDTSPDAELFPIKVWGFGWAFNFGYAASAAKPLWQRIGAWVLGMLLLLGILYAVLAVLFFACNAGVSLLLAFEHRDALAVVRLRE